MKPKTEQSEVISRARAGQRLIALGEALAVGGDVGFPVDGDQLALSIPGDVSLAYEVKLDEPGRAKLEIELEWPAAAVQRLAGTTGQASVLVENLPEGASSPGRPERSTGEAARSWYDTGGFMTGPDHGR